MKSKLEELAGFWVFVSNVYDHKMNPDQLRVYVEDVMDFSVEELKNAFKLYRGDHTRTFTGMPRPEILISYLSPKAMPMSTAVDVAHRIWNAISERGYTNIERAREDIGELGWKVVGGDRAWVNLCQTTENSKRETCIAQWREQARAYIDMAKNGLLDQAPRLPSADMKKLQPGLKKLVLTEFGG